ncbi:MAG: radical SAM protein [Desulfobacterales bacterium]|nr:MAG: radical SAM protein [Desulfobacterales bacterium]
MARLQEKEYTYFTTVRGMCRQCKNIVPARVYFQDESVWQQSMCPDCRNEPALIAEDKDWYLKNVIKPMSDHSPLPGAKPSQNGCPHDCGLCTWHASPCLLPVIPITSDCNLRCPVCFTFNRNDKIYFKPVSEMKKTIDWLVKTRGSLDLVNITGGEPTLHPEILDIIRVCKREEIGRVTMSTNGIILAKNYDLCQKLAELETCVVLSFNTFDGNVSIKMNGKDLVETKLKTIDNLHRAGARMTLINVLTHDHNENAIGGIFDLMQKYNNILSLTIQNMTYSGQGGSSFERTRHIPVDQAIQIVCEESGGMFEKDDFFARPSAHPLCYQICYMIKNGDGYLPLARFAPPEKIQQLIQDSYLMRPGHQEVYTDAINQLYAEGKTEHLELFRTIIEKLYPPGKHLNNFQRQQVSEEFIRAIFIHAHMDEDNFDCARAMMCTDQVPTEPGTLKPICTYNLFDRTEDERFHVK